MGKFRHHLRHGLRALIVLPKFVGETGVRVGTDADVSDLAKGRHVLAELFGTEGAIQTDGQGVGVAQGGPEGFRGLPGKGTPGGIRDGAGQDQGQGNAALFEGVLHGEDRRLGIKRVEDGFDEDEIHAPVDEGKGCLFIGGDKLIEVDVSKARVVHVRGQACGAIGWA